MNSQNGELLNFLAQLRRIALPLMQYLLITLAITIENEAIEQKGGFLGMLLGTSY